MSVEQWGIVAGVATALLMAVGPWMFMVHARLAVLAEQTARLETKVDKLVEAAEERLAWCIEHQTAIAQCNRRLELHESQLAEASRRLAEV
jgi:hypothetical protein